MEFGTYESKPQDIGTTISLTWEEASLLMKELNQELGELHKHGHGPLHSLRWFLRNRHVYNE